MPQNGQSVSAVLFYQKGKRPLLVLTRPIKITYSGEHYGVKGPIPLNEGRLRELFPGLSARMDSSPRGRIPIALPYDIAKGLAKNFTEATERIALEELAKIN